MAAGAASTVRVPSRGVDLIDDGTTRRSRRRGKGGTAQGRSGLHALRHVLHDQSVPSAAATNGRSISESHDGHRAVQARKERYRPRRQPARGYLARAATGRFCRGLATGRTRTTLTRPAIERVAGLHWRPPCALRRRAFEIRAAREAPRSIKRACLRQAQGPCSSHLFVNFNNTDSARAAVRPRTARDRGGLSRCSALPSWSWAISRRGAAASPPGVTAAAAAWIDKGYGSDRRSRRSLRPHAKLEWPSSCPRIPRWSACHRPLPTFRRTSVDLAKKTAGAGLEADRRLA